MASNWALTAPLLDIRVVIPIYCYNFFKAFLVEYAFNYTDKLERILPLFLSCFYAYCLLQTLHFCWERKNIFAPVRSLCPSYATAETTVLLQATQRELFCCFIMLFTIVSSITSAL